MFLPLRIDPYLVLASSRLLLNFHSRSFFDFRLVQFNFTSSPLFFTKSVQLPVVTQKAATKTNTELVIDSVQLHYVER